jgi:hypothetical protein
LLSIELERPAVFKVDVYGNLNFSGSPLNYLVWVLGIICCLDCLPKSNPCRSAKLFASSDETYPLFSRFGGMNMRTIQFSPGPHDVKEITAITASL